MIILFLLYVKHTPYIIVLNYCWLFPFAIFWWWRGWTLCIQLFLGMVAPRLPSQQSWRATESSMEAGVPLHMLRQIHTERYSWLTVLVPWRLGCPCTCRDTYRDIGLTVLVPWRLGCPCSCKDRYTGRYSWPTVLVLWRLGCPCTCRDMYRDITAWLC